MRRRKILLTLVAVAGVGVLLVIGLPLPAGERLFDDVSEEASHLVRGLELTVGEDAVQLLPDGVVGQTAARIHDVVGVTPPKTVNGVEQQPLVTRRRIIARGESVDLAEAPNGEDASRRNAEGK